MSLRLSVLPQALAVSRLAPDAAFPSWGGKGAFRAACWTDEELSLVCDEQAVPTEEKAERGWRALKVAGPLDFALTGILLRIAEPLAQAGVSLFAVSTFDTDYVLVKQEALSNAIRALTGAGHTVLGGG